MDSPVTIKRETAFYVNETGHVSFCFLNESGSPPVEIDPEESDAEQMDYVHKTSRYC